MTTPLDITSFHHGETVRFSINAKSRDGSIISNAANQTLTFLIGATPGGDPIIEANSSPQVVLVDAADGTYLVAVPASSYAAQLSEDTLYHYMITTTAPGEEPIVQRYGKFQFKPSINWS